MNFSSEIKSLLVSNLAASLGFFVMPKHNVLFATVLLCGGQKSRKMSIFCVFDENKILQKACTLRKTVPLTENVWVGEGGETKYF